MAKQIKRLWTTAGKARRKNRDACDTDLEPGAVFGEVETFDDLAPTLLALLQALPSGTRIYLRVKCTVH
jgi:hypothetical protein